MPDSAGKNLQVLLDKVKDKYKEYDIPHNMRFAHIRLTMISQTGSVRLKGRAAEVRRLARPLHAIFKEYSGSASVSVSMSMLLLEFMFMFMFMYRGRC